MPKYEHIEDDVVRGTIIEDMSEEEIAKRRHEVEDMRKHGLVVTIDDCEIVLQGFITVVDSITKDEVLHYKIKTNPNNKPEDNFVLYHLTPHPDSLRLLNRLKLLADIYGFPVVNVIEHCRHVAKLAEQIYRGKTKTENGIHPNMKYLHSEKLEK